jgi:hypothetical protein
MLDPCYASRDLVVVPHALITTCHFDLGVTLDVRQHPQWSAKRSGFQETGVLGGMYTAEPRQARLHILYTLLLFFGAHLYARCRAPLGNRLRTDCTAVVSHSLPKPSRTMGDERSSLASKQCHSSQVSPEMHACCRHGMTASTTVLDFRQTIVQSLRGSASDCPSSHACSSEPTEVNARKTSNPSP